VEAEPRRVEPWPVALALLLAAMVAACVAFWWVAETHPDPLVIEEAAR
jgi:hypothetical protein